MLPEVGAPGCHWGEWPQGRFLTASPGTQRAGRPAVCPGLQLPSPALTSAAFHTAPWARNALSLLCSSKTALQDSGHIFYSPKHSKC